MTGLFGGLASSTAVTVSLSRIAQGTPSLHPSLTGGIAVSAGMMFFRVLLVTGIVNPPLAFSLALPLGLMGGACCIGALAMAWNQPAAETAIPPALEDPAEIAMAVKFAIFLIIVITLSHFVRQWFGDHGIFAIAAIAGLADVDAITLSLARMEDGVIATSTAAIVIAVSVNTVVKGGIAAVIGGKGLIVRVGSIFTAALAIGLLALWLV